VHDETQMRNDQLPRGGQIAFLAEAAGEFDFFLFPEDRNLRDTLDIGVEIAPALRSGTVRILDDQGVAHDS